MVLKNIFITKESSNGRLEEWGKDMEKKHQSGRQRLTSQ